MESLTRKGLSLERLRSFLRVAEAGGFARAAPAEPVTQSQLNRQVRELEDALGCALFERRGRHVELTVSGERLAAVVRDLLSGLSEVSTGESRRTTVSLGAGDSVVQWVLLPAVAALRAKFPPCA